MSSNKIFNLLVLGILFATALAVIAHFPQDGSLSGMASITDTPSESQEWPTYNQENLEQYVVDPNTKGVPRTPTDYNQQQSVDFVLPVDQK